MADAAARAAVAGGHAEPAGAAVTAEAAVAHDLAARTAATTVGAEPAVTAGATVTDSQGVPAATTVHAGHGAVPAGPTVTSQKPAVTTGRVCLCSGDAVANHATDVAGRHEQAVDLAVDILTDWTADPGLNERVGRLIDVLLEGLSESGAVGCAIANQAKIGQQFAQRETAGGVGGSCDRTDGVKAHTPHIHTGCGIETREAVRNGRHIHGSGGIQSR